MQKGLKMNRSFLRWNQRIICFALLGIVLVTSSGCIHSILATGLYLVQGGNFVSAEYDGLKGQRVVVVCRPPSSHEYQHAGAASSIARQVSRMLEINVKNIDIVDSSEVDDWTDMNDVGDFKGLGRAVNADQVVHIELEQFELYKGRTLYQGNSDVTITVYNMKENGKRVWERNLGQVLYPRHSGIPAQDKPIGMFQREYEDVLAAAIAIHFYKHDPHASFAIDAMANN